MPNGNSLRIKITPESSLRAVYIKKMLYFVFYSKNHEDESKLLMVWHADVVDNDEILIKQAFSCDSRDSQKIP